MDQIRFDSELLLEQCKVLQSMQKRSEDLFDELIIVEKELSVIRENQIIANCRSAIGIQKKKMAENLNAVRKLSAAIIHAVDALNQCEADLTRIADKAEDARDTRSSNNPEGKVLHLGDILIIPDYEWRFPMHFVPLWLAKTAIRLRNRTGLSPLGTRETDGERNDVGGISGAW